MEQPKEGVLGSDVQVNAFIGVPSEPFVYGTISGGFQVKSLQGFKHYVVVYSRLSGLARYNSLSKSSNLSKNLQFFPFIPY